ncbi:MAG: hypothetical protein HXS48_16915 [Theionarchaea archaeon]|nr:hypothetical protein [Theionarchaea archaeon]
MYFRTLKSSLKRKSQSIRKSIITTKDKDDLPHVVAYLLSGSDCFVTTNRRLTQMEMPEPVEFMTPREFVEDMLDIRGFDVHY